MQVKCAGKMGFESQVFRDYKERYNLSHAASNCGNSGMSKLLSSHVLIVCIEKMNSRLRVDYYCKQDVDWQTESESALPTALM